MPFNSNDIEWNKTETKPAQTKVDGGWEAGEKPAPSIWNWFFNRCALAIKDLLTNAIHTDQKGVANGVATLGADGKVPAGQLNISAPADATTSQKGIVQLSSSTTSTDETTAATPKAVKTAMDQANAAFTSANNGKALTGPVATAIVGKGGTVADSDSDGVATFQELANGVNTIKRGQGNAVETQVLSGSTFANSDGTLRTGTMPNKTASATVLTPGTADQTIPQGYFPGTLADGKVKGDANLIPSNIVKGKNIFGVAGNFAVGKANGTATSSGTKSGFINSNGGGTLSLYSLTVTGLAFTPSLIHVFSSEYEFGTYWANTNLYNQDGDFLLNGLGAAVRIGIGTPVGVGVVTSSGFTIPVNNSNSSYYWVAYE